MKKNIRVITINGINGIIMAIFIVFGLVSGFIIAPAFVCMKLWNSLLCNYVSVSQMNIYQGLLLWSIIALIVYARNNKRALIGFGAYQKLSNEQIRDIVRKSQMYNPNLFPDFESLQNKIKAEINKSANFEKETNADQEQAPDNNKEIGS